MTLDFALEEPDLPFSLGPLEQRVMNQLWAQGAMTVRDVHQTLHDAGSDLAYTTVMTIMVRLANKGFLTRESRGRQFAYSTVVSAEEFRSHAAHALAEGFVRDYDQLAIASFVEELAKVSPDRLKDLRELADRAYRNDERPD